VTCFDHQIGRLPPDPCHGTALFHNAAGDVLKKADFDLKPGESRGLTFTFTSVIGDVSPIFGFPIDPCWIPTGGGRAVPSVEVFDAAGHLLLFENPASPRMSEFNNDFMNPGVIAG